MFEQPASLSQTFMHTSGSTQAISSAATKHDVTSQILRKKYGPDKCSTEGVPLCHPLSAVMHVSAPVLSPKNFAMTTRSSGLMFMRCSSLLK